jgi:transcription-repair coupling factor (superfamily II helicase)
LIKIALDAYIPDSYVESTSNRMTIYKNISRIETKEERDKLIAEVEDVFGKLPKSAENLFDIAYIKALAKRIGVTEVYCTENEIKFIFDAKENKIMSKQLSNALNKYSAVCVLNFKEMPTITFKYTGNDVYGNFNILKDFLIISNENAKK